MNPVKTTLFTFLLLLNLFKGSEAHNVLDDHSQVTLRLKWHHQFQFAGYYAAQSKGFYHEAGLDVKIIGGISQISTIQYVLMDSAEYGISSLDIIERRAENEPLVLLAALFQHSPFVIISLKEKNILKPKDLIGKRVMISKQQGYTQFQAILRKDNVSPDDVYTVNPTGNFKDLINGKVDAMSGYISTEPYQLNQLGYEVNLIKPNDYNTDFYGDLLFTTEKEIVNHPERVRAFREASIKGWEYALGHIDEIISDILEMPGVKERGITRDHLMHEALAIQKLVKSEIAEIGHINKQRINLTYKWYKDVGIIPKDSNPEGLIYTSDIYIKENIYIKYIWYIIGTGLLLTALVFLWNRQLRNQVKWRTSELQREVEHRREAEMIAKKSEERLELALSAAHLGIWDSNLVSGEVVRNDNWASMLGYSPDEINTDYESWRNLVHPEDYEKIDLSIKNHYEGESLFDSYEHRLLTKTGEWKWILALSKIVSRNELGKPTRLIGIHIDIDDLKNKELQLKQITEELMYTNHELEKFAYITSHNLRAPVVNIISLLEMRDEEGQSEEFNKLILDKVKQSVSRLESTLNDLIEVVSAKKLTLTEKSDLLLSDTVKTVLLNLETQLQKVNTEIVQDYSNADSVHYIKSVLESIIQNLITNSIKYKSPQRNLLIHIYTTQDEDYVYLHIKDNGLGFDSNIFGSKIFRLYERIHHNIEGKGMGLYLVKSQVESLNGRIEVLSKPNEGAMFIVSFKKEKYNV